MLSLLALVLAAPPEAPIVESPDFPSEVQKAAFTATVRITNLGTDFRFGTGVIVGVQEGHAIVLTANHVLGQPADRRVDFFSLASYPNPIRVNVDALAIVALQLPTQDIALLKVPIPREIKVPSEKKGSPKDPNSVTTALLSPVFERPRRFPVKAFSIGCEEITRPPEIKLTTIYAKTLVRKSENEVSFFWETDNPPVLGRSGGGLFDKSGQVIGICSANKEGKGYYVHLDEIQVGLKKNGYEWLFEAKR